MNIFEKLIKLTEQFGIPFIEKDGTVLQADETPLTSEMVEVFNNLESQEVLQQQLAEAQQYLTDTDYVVVKIAEAMVAGEDITAMKAQYADVISEREVKRTFIRENS